MYKKIVKGIFSVGGIILLSKLFGFIRQTVLANQFGATQETDIVFFANGVIDNLSNLITQSLQAAFVPIYIGFASNEKGKKRFVSNVLKVLLLIAGIFVLLNICFAPIICKIIAPTYKGEVYKEFVKNMRLFAPNLFLSVIIAIYCVLLRANKKFVQGEMIGIHQSVIVIALSLVLGKKYGINILVASVYVYSIYNLVYLGIYGKKFNELNWENPIKDENIQRLLKMILPMLFGYAVVYINQQVDKILTSGIEEGALTSLGYGAVLIGFITTLASSISTVVYTYIAELIVTGKNKIVADMYLQISIVMVTIFLPISVLTIMNAADIVSLVFGRGAFDQRAVLNSSYALMGYSISIIPTIFVELFCRFQYSYCDTKHPTFNNAVAIILNIILSIILCPQYGILGVTLASSLSMILCAYLNYLTSKRHNLYLKVSCLLRYVPLWGVGSLFIIVCSVKGRELLGNNNVFIRLFLIGIVSIIVYIVFVGPIIYFLIKKLGIKVKKELK